MVFSSYEFIFVFLPIALVGYFGIRTFFNKSASLLWLIAVSLAFYSVWDPWNLGILLFSAVVNFCCGTNLAARARSHKPVRMLLAVGVAFNLGMIGYFKYAGFFAANLNVLLGTDIPALKLVLPLAISFFTFQEIAYLVDSSRGQTYGYRFREYLLMVSFFPHLIAGPIVNHKILMPQFMSAGALRISPQMFALGIGLFVFGLGKKVIFADGLAAQANLFFDHSLKSATPPSFAEAWIGSLAYTLQLYYDFSGYSDMAIGLGLLFGVRLPVNFNSPYQATSIIDFWRRWHITLSTFLRDYLYFPLGGNRHGATRRHLNLLITMILGGLWHGAGWTFICWGALHGVGLTICHFWRAIPYSTNFRFGSEPLRRALSRTLTLLFVIFGWVLFRADSMEAAGTAIAAMIGLNGLSFTVEADRQFTTVLTIAQIGALAAIALFARNSQQWLGYDADSPVENDAVWTMQHAARPAHGAILGCVFVFILTQMSAVQSFLYFQF